MLIIKNKINAPIEINLTKIYPGENKKIPNIRMNDHIRNLVKRGIIGVSEIPDTTVISSEESKKSSSKINENEKSATDGANKEASIDPQNVTDSIEVPADSTTTSTNKRSNKSKGEK